MKKALVGIFVCMLLIGTASIVTADWDEGEGFKMHFPQLPDVDGFDVDWGYWFLGDDWKCTETGTVDDIHFWLSWFFDDPMTIDEIYVSIWSNNPEGPGGYSQPLELLWERAFTPTQFVMRQYGSGNQRWMMPWGEIIPQYHNLIFQINIVGIDDPFEQIEGEVYWLVIKMPFTTINTVGWKNTENYYMDHAVWSEEPGSGEWQMIDGIDFAFVITGDTGPEPECCLVIDEMWGGFFDSPSSLGVNAVIKNNGTAECKDIDWNFAFTGGIVLWGPKSGTEASLLPGATTTVSSNIVFGLAIPGIIFPGNVTVYADCPNNVCPPATMEKQMFLFFILLAIF
jgi:hypothetical protein